MFDGFDKDIKERMKSYYTVNMLLIILGAFVLIYDVAAKAYDAPLEDQIGYVFAGLACLFAANYFRSCALNEQDTQRERDIEKLTAHINELDNRVEHMEAEWSDCWDGNDQTE